MRCNWPLWLANLLACKMNNSLWIDFRFAVKFSDLASQVAKYWITINIYSKCCHVNMIMDVTSTFLQPDFGSLIALNRLCVVSIILYLLSRVNLNELGHLKYQNDTSPLKHFALMVKVGAHGNCCRHFSALDLQSTAACSPSSCEACKTSFLIFPCVIQHLRATSPNNNFLIPSIHCPRPVNEALKPPNNTFQWQIL